MHRSIIGMIENGIFGIPYVGADICGFTSETNEELCTRWQQVGAFYPFSRNHNVKDTKDQDPAVFSQYMIDSTKAALNVRYTILPYYYTLFFKAHLTGSLVVKGLFQEFPFDKNCRTIDRQYLVGPAFLVSPVLEPGKSKVDVYFPPESRWFSYYDGAEANTGYATLNAPLNFINLHVRGGHILPTQKPANNTSFSRKNPFGLIVALDQNGQADGELFHDDGDSIDSIEKSRYFLAKFSYVGNKLKMIINKNGSAELAQNRMYLDTVRVFGFDTSRTSQVQIAIKTASESRFTILNVTNANINSNGAITLTDLNLKITEEFEIDFKAVQVPEVVDLTDERLRADCFPEPGASEWACNNRKCTWASSSIQGIPWCFINKNRVSYAVDGSPTTTNGVERSLKEYFIRKVDTLSFYGEDMARLKVSVEKKGAKMVRIKLEDAFNKRYEVPVATTWANQVEAADGKLADNDLEVNIENDSLGRFVIEVFRKSTGSRLISTREFAEAYVFSDRYQQLYLRLATENVFGFGENTHENFRHRFDKDSITYSVFARDEPPSGKYSFLIYSKNE